MNVVSYGSLHVRSCIGEYGSVCECPLRLCARVQVSVCYSHMSVRECTLASLYVCVRVCACM